jgi:hypothetical protein
MGIEAKVKRLARVSLAVAFFEGVLLISYIWPPIYLQPIYDVTLYWLLLCHAPTVITLPLGALCNTMIVRDSIILNDEKKQKRLKKIATPFIWIYMIAEALALIGASIAAIWRGVLMSQCSAEPITSLCKVSVQQRMAYGMIGLSSFGAVVALAGVGLGIALMMVHKEWLRTGGSKTTVTASRRKSSTTKSSDTAPLIEKPASAAAAAVPTSTASAAFGTPTAAQMAHYAHARRQQAPPSSTYAMEYHAKQQYHPVSYSAAALHDTNNNNTFDIYGGDAE